MDLLALALALTTAAAEPSEPPCAAPRAVTIRAEEWPIRRVLRDIAAEAQVELAVRPTVRGRVTADLRCVPVRTALRVVLPQAGATYCEEGGVILVRPADERGCRAAWMAPPAARVAH